MTEHNHAVVWLDHREAKIFHFNATDVDNFDVRTHEGHIHLHHKANSIGSGHVAEDKAFLHSVAEAIGRSKMVLVTGPGLAKTELMKHISAHHPTVAAHIVGVETVDHPTDKALVAHARAYFKSADLMTPQKQ